MLVPVEWLREYVDFDIDIQTLADRLTMSGLEVEEISEETGQPVYSTYVTPNRPDLLSMTGVARDISALLGTELRLPAVTLPENGADINELASVRIDSPVNCPRYSARVITDVKIVPSPSWMQERLLAAGMRPINNVVDATNYVLLELGQPLHAFDYDLITDHQIIVRQAEPSEIIRTIDGEERTLTPNTLVIADSKQAVAVAGVMGGFHSEVNAGSKNILLESAHFNRLPIRKTARTLQMSTEASFRFERNVDPALTIAALDRVAQLIIETGGGTVAKGIIDVYPVKIDPVTIAIRPERASMILGFDVTADQIDNYLTLLGMNVDRTDGIRVKIPTFRPDIQREEDLIEEVGRIYGYDRIPSTLPVGETMQGHDSDRGLFVSRVSRILISAGLQEIVTGSMVPPVENDSQVVIRNPISDDLSRLRDNLLLDLLGVISYNANRGVRDIALFEIGSIFVPDNACLREEKLSIAGAITGSILGPTWNMDRTILECDFFLCKGIIESVLDRLGIQNALFRAEDIDGFHPTRAAVIEIQGMKLGVMGEINSAETVRYGLPGRTYAFELDLNTLMALSGDIGPFIPISRYPAITRDLAVVVPLDVPYNRIEELLISDAGDLLENLTLFDLYTGAQLEAGMKSLAFKVSFRSHERTLRDDDVDDRLAKMKETLTSTLGAKFRDS
ncbi:MAG: phenylalanine--tRNA ligase subunit beta [Armatimonadota bacterium]